MSKIHVSVTKVDGPFVLCSNSLGVEPTFFLRTNKANRNSFVMAENDRNITYLFTCFNTCTKHLY